MTKSYKTLAIIISILVCMFYTQARVESSLPMDLALNTKVIFTHNQNDDNTIKVTDKTTSDSRAVEIIMNESRNNVVDNNNNFSLLSYNKEVDCCTKTLTSYLQKMKEKRTTTKSLSQLNILII